MPLRRREQRDRAGEGREFVDAGESRLAAGAYELPRADAPRTVADDESATAENEAHHRDAGADPARSDRRRVGMDLLRAQVDANDFSVVRAGKQVIAPLVDE